VLRRRLRQLLDADRSHASRDDMDPERYGLVVSRWRDQCGDRCDHRWTRQRQADPADTFGRYSFAGLQQAGFTLRASANGYTSVSKGITLTANTGDQQ
jgi:hypothetical protein